VEAKVDIRKLQFLNDRIAQVTDALNQVRLSVHGLQQAPFGLQQPQLGFQQPQFGFQPQLGFQQQGPYGAGTLGFPTGPFAWPAGGLQSPMIGGFGLQHATYSPYAQYQPQAIQGVQGIGQGWGSGLPSWPSFGGGLYHSPTELMEQRLGEQRAIDPNRILQTFPLCFASGSSVTSW
jgi:hypothetical protein